MTSDEVRARIAAIPHWYHAIEVRSGIVTPGAYEARIVLETLDLPDDCHEMRVLDLGSHGSARPGRRGLMIRGSLLRERGTRRR